MITLRRDETGCLWTPLTERLDQRARQIADAAGSITSKPAWSQAMADLRRNPEFTELAASHLRLQLADGDHLRASGQYYRACTPEERSALDSLWRRDAAAAPAPVTVFAYDSFEATIERTLRDRFGGDRGRYSEAMRATAAAHPDLLQKYLRSA